jgi:hypothetical protein
VTWVLAILFSISIFSEEPPPPEYPQRALSSSEDLGFEKPTRVGRDGAYYYDTKKEKLRTQRNYRGVEQPLSVGDDGTYYYDTNKATRKRLDTLKGIEAPEEIESDGGYYYSRKIKHKKPYKSPGIPQPSKISEDGSYLYDLENGETKNVFYLRAGLASSPSVRAPNGTSFQDVYGESDTFLLSLGYDWKLSRQLVLKFESGLSSSQGQGQFASGIDRQPQETFQLYVFPNTLSLNYKVRFSDTQWVTPYIEGGPGYFTFMEVRSDSDLFSFGDNKFGGAFVASASAGILISTSGWSTGNSLRSDYGATESWVDLQFRQIFGLDSRKDFTSSLITGGIAVGF